MPHESLMQVEFGEPFKVVTGRRPWVCVAKLRGHKRSRPDPIPKTAELPWLGAIYADEDGHETTETLIATAGYGESPEAAVHDATTRLERISGIPARGWTIPPQR